DRRHVRLRAGEGRDTQIGVDVEQFAGRERDIGEVHRSHFMPGTRASMPRACTIEPSRVSDTLKRVPFGELPDGTSVDLLTIQSDTLELSAIPYGGTIVSLRAPDRD